MHNRNRLGFIVMELTKLGALLIPVMCFVLFQGKVGGQFAGSERSESPQTVEEEVDQSTLEAPAESLMDSIQ